ncbi:MAG: TIGR04211 family SH3 domain-containing protein [Desulfocurvibacter africanus]
MVAAHRLAFAIVFAFIFFVASPAWSAYYVTDEHEFTLRTGPNTTHKIIQMLPTGSSLELLEDGDEWARVRTEKGREGWVAKRFIMQEMPKAMVLDQARKRYAQLQEDSKTALEQAKALSVENKDLQVSLESAKAELARISQEYEALRAESSEVIELKQQYQTASVGLESISGLVAKLTKENESLLSAESLNWFLAGAAAVLVPWLLGSVMGRFGGKRRERISF